MLSTADYYKDASVSRTMSLDDLSDGWRSCSWICGVGGQVTRFMQTTAMASLLLPQVQESPGAIMSPISFERTK
jgi:hypothetical protein